MNADDHEQWPSYQGSISRAVLEKANWGLDDAFTILVMVGELTLHCVRDLRS